MRIQHNIMAMNAYRNYNTNTSALSKNLEKLSSGYKINRAGDDAAGLAISEKMRAQISGLNAASKNVKDGISLVKTAEGAMQEIQDMLNRMKYLATQSANGTYDNETDRFNLQKEVDSLNAEINRIADSANFNGINLLDGKMGFGSSSAQTPAAAATVESIKVAGAAVTEQDVPAKAAAAAKYTYKIDTALGAGDAGTITVAGVSVTVGNGSGDIDVGTATTAAAQATALQTKLAADTNLSAAYDVTVTGDTVTLTKKVAGVDGDAATMKAGVTLTTGAITVNEETAGADAKAATKGYDMSGTLATGDEVKINGKTYTFDAAAAAGDATKFKDLADLKTKLDADGVTMDDTDNTAVTFTQKAADTTKPTFTPDATKLAAFDIKSIDFKDATVDAESEVKAKYDQASQTLSITVGDKTYKSAALTAAPDGGSKLTLTEDGGTATIEVTLAGTTGNASTILGDTAADVNEDTIGKLTPAADNSGDGTLTLQIGDTSDPFNRLIVRVGDMHTDALGYRPGQKHPNNDGTYTYDAVAAGASISEIDISTLPGAQKAIDVIKGAINYVSSVRGDLGATQNRLEHTANNLSVMTENIQDAESTIRDTDVAEEMMAYTKNNILIQSAQAMLAQANQVPQGVLQLLG